MEMALSKTAAIREARTCVSIDGRGTSWNVYGPYRNSDLSGPSTSLSAASYEQARRMRATWVADIALTLMGYSDEESVGEPHAQSWNGITRVEDLVAMSAAKIEQRRAEARG
jgi:hypothetical protein